MHYLPGCSWASALRSSLEVLVEKWGFLPPWRFTDRSRKRECQEGAAKEDTEYLASIHPPCLAKCMESRVSTGNP